jgi:hypothetical protein
MKSHTMKKPEPLSPHALLVSQLPGLLSLWKYDREGGKMWLRTGLGLITAWVGLQRLGPPQRPSEWLPRLDEVIRDDAANFLAVALASRFEYESWRREVEQIDTAWDRDLSREEAEELEWRSEQAFNGLDHAELLAWFAVKQAPGDPRVQGWVEPLRRECQAAGAFIAERPDRFLCLASDLAHVIACSRPGLETDDPQLWETLGKHRRIEEARDEVELTLSGREILGLLRRTARPIPSPRLVEFLRDWTQTALGSEPVLALAAHAMTGFTLPSKAVQLNSAVFRAAGDDHLRISFDLTEKPAPHELLVYLSPQEAARSYRAVHLELSQGKSYTVELFADFASIPLDAAALGLLIGATNGTIRLELITADGLARPILLEEAAA